MKNLATVHQSPQTCFANTSYYFTTAKKIFGRHQSTNIGLFFVRILGDSLPFTDTWFPLAKKSRHLANQYLQSSRVITKKGEPGIN